MTRRYPPILVAVLVIIWLSGCGLYVRGMGNPDTQRDFSLPASEVFNIAVEAIDSPPFSLGISDLSSSQGMLVSNWEAHDGDEHGIGPWRKRWQARTRFLARVTPQFSNPATRCVVAITSESQERPNSQYEWKNRELEHGPQRSAELLARIAALVRSRTTERR
jgi:hypothetical protein